MLQGQQRQAVLVLLAILGSGGILFNLFQIIIIISGGYNRNPDISPPLLQTLDAIATTLLWLLVSIAIVLAVIGAWYQQKS